MNRFERGEVIAALVMASFGVLWLVVGRDYSWGSSVRIGAAVFPLGLAVILIGLCGVVAWQARGATRDPLTLRPKPVVLILGGILAWALTVDVIGFVPATAILVACCTLAERESTWASAAILTGVLCAFGYAVFIVGLNIPLPVFGG